MRVHVEFIDGAVLDIVDAASADLTRSGTVLDVRRRVHVPTGPQSYTYADVDQGVPLFNVRWWTVEGKR